MTSINRTAARTRWPARSALRNSSCSKIFEMRRSTTAREQAISHIPAKHFTPDPGQQINMMFVCLNSQYRAPGSLQTANVIIIGIAKLNGDGMDD